VIKNFRISGINQSTVYTFVQGNYQHFKEKIMLSKINPTHTASWKNLKNILIRSGNIIWWKCSVQDENRFNKFSIQFDDMLLDYSKNRIYDETIDLLIEMADELNLKEAIESMFTGEKINLTERRAVLHVALRNRNNDPIYVEGKDVMPDINKVLDKMKKFSSRVIDGSWKGFTGKRITDIVNIGIGGSALGPLMVSEALKPYHIPHLKMHFVSNVDGSQISETLSALNPETSFF
jgi:glucose-6-phosphate isomerase